MICIAAPVPARIIAVVGATLWPVATIAQSAASTAQLSQRKLELEIAKLEAETNILAHPVVLPLLIFAVGLVGNIFLYLLNRKAADARTAAEEERNKLTILIEPRLEAYAKAFELLKPTALFFPPAARPKIEHGADPDPETPVLTGDDCRNMGRGFSDWYFGAGGLLMTKRSRDAYFALMKALQEAAGSKPALMSHKVGEHANVMSLESVDAYREELGLKKPDKKPWFGWFTWGRGPEGTDLLAAKAEKWTFGEPLGEGSARDAKEVKKATEAKVAKDAKDYILIQTLASRLRTALAEDIESRDPPGANKGA